MDATTPTTPLVAATDSTSHGTDHGTDHGTHHATDHGVDGRVARITVDHVHGRVTVLVTVCGDLDMATAPELTALIDPHIRTARHNPADPTPNITTPDGTTVVFDLQAVTFIDCVGVNALLRYHRDGIHPAHTVTLTRIPTRVRRILHLAGLTDYFHLDDTTPHTDPAAA